MSCSVIVYKPRSNMFLLFIFCRSKLTNNVLPILVSYELRNKLFSVKDKNSCET